MRALKVLIVVMGVMLVGGTVTLVVLLINRAGRAPAAPTSVAASGPGTARGVVELPAGARIESTSTTGDRLVVRVSLPDGGTELILFDMRNASRLGTIELRPAGAPGAAKAGNADPAGAKP
jgi:hypothetical protein